MSSFLRSFLPLVLVVALGLAAGPAHTGAAEQRAQAGHALHQDGRCPSHQDQGHATAAECLQGGHCIPLSPGAMDLAHKLRPGPARHAPHDESASSAPPETSTPPPRPA